jgi:hypothetical protein
VPDHGLRVHGRLRVCREFAHRGRAAESIGALAQLGENLLVAVALADAGTERIQTLLIDAGDLRVPTALHHCVPSSALPSVTNLVQIAGEYTRCDPHERGSCRNPSRART